MAYEPPEVFGSPAQQALERRAFDLWQLLKNVPDYSYHGRVVAVSGDVAETSGLQIALARLQGVGPAGGVPLADADTRREALIAAGLKTDEYVSWQGGAAAVNAARQVLADRALPEDLDLITVGPETDSETLAKLDVLAGSCDVLLPIGRVLRGQERPAVCLMARDRDGSIVATTAAVAQFHPDHRDSDRAWWGMLATDQGRRGEGIALVMGAHSLLAMADRYGYQKFFTGIRAGNTPSEKLCSRLGLAPADCVDMIAIWPPAFEDSQLTK